jgi:hypothetical protein
VPPTEERFGNTERIIGSWFASRKRRDRVILATKIIGPDQRFKRVRGGNNRFDRRTVLAAVAASLERLCTDQEQHRQHRDEAPPALVREIEELHKVWTIPKRSGRGEACTKPLEKLQEVMVQTDPRRGAVEAAVTARADAPAQLPARQVAYRIGASCQGRSKDDHAQNAKKNRIGSAGGATVSHRS